MSRLLTYVETPNQCRLTRRLIPPLQEHGISVDVVYLPKFLGPALRAHVRQLGARFIYTPDGKLPVHLSRHDLYERFGTVIDDFTHIASQYPLFLTWNDGTNTTRRLVPAARRSSAMTVVVQDGFLDQIPATNGGRLARWSSAIAGGLSSRELHLPILSKLVRGRLYPRFNFGYSKADQYFVYGPAMRRKMHMLLGTPLGTIELVGSPDMSQSALDFACLEQKRIAQRDKLQILFLDQCHVAHGKLALADWQRTYPELVATLARHDLTIKLHPGESPQIQRKIYEYVGESARIIADGFSQGLDMSRFDVVVTATSSAFLDALAARVPVLLFQFPGLVESFPAVRSGVVKQVGSLKELRHFLDKLDRERVFIGNRTGVTLESLFARPSELPFERHLALRLAALIEGCGVTDERIETRHLGKAATP